RGDAVRPRQADHHMTEALVGLALMMALALLRIPIAISMGVIGFLGVAYLRDWNFAPAFAMVETKIYETGRNYTLSVVPLFILIPPTTIMVIYGVLTETNIGKLFAAGILPGILATFLLCLAVQWIVLTDPASGPRGKRSTWRERLVALEGVWPVALLFIVVMG